MRAADLIGQTIKSVTYDDYEQELVIELEIGKLRMYHPQECCEDVGLIDGYEDLRYLVGSKILDIRRDTNYILPVPPGRRRDNEQLWTFYNFRTSLGYATLRWFGSSNGYYGIEVDAEFTWNDVTESPRAADLCQDIAFLTDNLPPEPSVELQRMIAEYKGLSLQHTINNRYLKDTEEHEPISLEYVREYHKLRREELKELEQELSTYFREHDIDPDLVDRVAAQYARRSALIAELQRLPATAAIEWDEGER